MKFYISSKILEKNFKYSLYNAKHVKYLGISVTKDE